MIPTALECSGISREVIQDGVLHTLAQNVEFQLDRGQVLAILGPSGSGKTTLLRMLNRLDEPTAGTLLLNGQDALQMPPQILRRHVGMVMQQPYLFAGTVASNLQYGPKQCGEILNKIQIRALLEQVGLPDYAARDAKTLSGGEAQRVAIARALANNPEVLLLDEPTSALDDVSKLSIELLLTQVMKERHLSCVWVTHDRAQARRIANKVLLLEAGRVIAFGSTAEILDA